MCLVALAIQQHPRYPLVIASNRDEYFERPTAPLAWWRNEPGAPDILGGRDLRDGGTWLGLSTAGRLALVTNIRRPGVNNPTAPSRGGIVPLWLRSDLDADAFLKQVTLSGHNPFNLVAADFRRGACYWASSEAPSPRTLDAGLYGLSNAALDTPWPKVERLKQRLGHALACARSAQALGALLFTALADRAQPEDHELPDTGVPLEWERLLAPAFIHTALRRYGTRSSTLVIAERVGRRLVTHVFERSFSDGGAQVRQHQATLRDWPPKAGKVLANVENTPVSVSEVEPGCEALAEP